MNEAVTKSRLFEVNLQFSRHLLLVLLACLSAASVALWLSAVPWILKCLVEFFVCIYAREYYCLYIALIHKRSIQAVRLINDQWRVKRQGVWYRAWPTGEIVVTSFLICCRMKLEGGHRPGYLILFPDSADAVELHGLRLKLMLDSHHCLLKSE